MGRSATILTAWLTVACQSEAPAPPRQRSGSTPTPPKVVAEAAPDEVVAWIDAHAIDVSEDRALDEVLDVVGDARVVALGEATHGTREFFRFKHRLLQTLVRERGFSVLAMEAPFAESLAIDRYVTTGEGEAAAALTGLGYPVWDTQEVRTMIEWMRAHNADPDHATTVRFFGFDGQRGAAEASHPDPAVARQLAEIARQARVIARTPGERDPRMADNVAWIVEHAGPNARVVVWAHNGHVATMHEPLRMGARLRQRFGDDLVVFGFAFDHGAFRAQPDPAGAFTTFSVGPAPVDTLDATLARARPSALVLDLRALPAGALVTQWFRAPHRTRYVGTHFDPTRPAQALPSHAVTELYDALVFFEATEASRP